MPQTIIVVAHFLKLRVWDLIASSLPSSRSLALDSDFYLQPKLLEAAGNTGSLHLEEERLVLGGTEDPAQKEDLLQFIIIFT
ncbi:hypothetical protein AAHA92_18462 [Salvia divinorum]|uniref:Uncharacterized protein n=1 Tax=Salvia divinorum TaxID=28513 RepID=A0ABD1H268_SALDI